MRTRLSSVVPLKSWRGSGSLALDLIQLPPTLGSYSSVDLRVSESISIAQPPVTR